MSSFPKKYKTQDLRNRAKIYREKKNNYGENNTSQRFFINTLPISRKLTYNDFFPIYMSDFISHKKNLENRWLYPNSSNNISEQLFIIYGDQLQNICSSYDFFKKRNQTLSQIGTNKLERHVTSQNKKNFNINKKILDSYLSSPHKIYIQDSSVYLYILEKFRTLREENKITKEIKIGYRSFNLQTSIPPQDILRKEEKIPCYTLKYFVGAKCEALPVCVEDIDLCCGDVALLVHPKDKRYNKYIGKNAIIPLCNRQIPIIGDENVNIAIDNGIKRVCPCSNEESIYLANKYGLSTDIYVFNKQGLYSEYIHEPAFIGQERDKYYNNIVGFIEDIGNLAEKGEKTIQVPYLSHTKERLVPYKMEQFVIKLQEEKQKILNQIFDGTIKFSFIDKNYGETLEELSYAKNELDDFLKDKEINVESNDVQEDEVEDLDKINNLHTRISQLKQEIIDGINTYLPDTIICNSQLSYGWRLPIIQNNNGESSFFNIESDCLNRKDKPLQLCFNFILLSLIREGTIKNRVYEYDKFLLLLSENEKKIQHFMQHLANIIGNKSEHEEFLHIIQNIADENSSTKGECVKLIKNCKYINEDGNGILINIEGLSNDIIDPEFIHLCIPCHLNNIIGIEEHVILNENERHNAFESLLIQELLLGKTIFNSFTEYSCTNYEFIGNKQLNKIQMEQSQWDSFLTYGENPVRLNFLINQTYDQKEILLNSIFLKQIRNAVRLCLQKNFLPKNIEECLDQKPETFEDFDVTVLYKIGELYQQWHSIETYEEYSEFFLTFKKDIQNIFFSRYIEMQKVQPTKNVQFVCSYFFNFLFTLLYPITPEFIDALQYVSKRDFLLPVKPVNSCQSIDYTMNIIFKMFTEVKDLKIKCNIKQHESCKMFIKGNPSILDVFNEHEQIFKNYFHISEITYLRLHEQNPLGYETFTDETLTIGFQPENTGPQSKKDSIETIERDIRNLEDKLNLLRQRIQLLPEGEQRTKTEEEYAQTKDEIETLTIRHSLLSSK